MKVSQIYIQYALKLLPRIDVLLSSVTSSSSRSEEAESCESSIQGLEIQMQKEALSKLEAATGREAYKTNSRTAATRNKTQIRKVA